MRAWIGTLTRRLCVDTLRASGREIPAEAPIEIEDTNDELAQIDEALMVHEAMKQLPEHCAEILDRFFARDESYHDDRRGAGPAPRHDRQPDLPLPAEDEKSTRGKKTSVRAV